MATKEFPWWQPLRRKDLENLDGPYDNEEHLQRICTEIRRRQFCDIAAVTACGGIPIPRARSDPHLPQRVARRMNGMGYEKGTPDLILIRTGVSDDGVLICGCIVEFKDTTDWSDEQLAFADSVMQHGGWKRRTVRSVREFRSILEELHALRPVSFRVANVDDLHRSRPWLIEPRVVTNPPTPHSIVDLTCDFS